MTLPSAHASIDRRSQRTRLALRAALIGLIAERGWDAIAVQDLCERANVGRSTFYSHFPNKDALLLGGLEDLRGELARQAVARSRAAGSRAAAHGFGFSLGLIEHAHEQRKVFRGMIGRPWPPMCRPVRRACRNIASVQSPSPVSGSGVRFAA